MEDNIAKAKAMLAFITKECDEQSIDDSFVKAIVNVFYDVLERRGERLKQEYIRKEIDRIESLSTDMAKFKEILSTAAEKQEQSKPEQPVAEATKQERGPVNANKKRKYERPYDELIDFEINRNKYKYTSVYRHTWMNEMGLDPITRAMVVQHLLKIAYDKQLGITREVVKYAKYKRLCYCFPGPVYREFIDMYNTFKLPQKLRSRINKCASDKKHTEKRQREAAVA